MKEKRRASSYKEARSYYDIRWLPTVISGVALVISIIALVIRIMKL